MLSIFFYSFCTLFLYSTFGFFIKKKTEANNTHFTDLVIYGIITISFIALLINFFAPLSKNINSLLFIPCLLIFIKFREQLNTKKFYYFLLFGSFLSTILLFASHTYRPDAGLYHLPFVNILNEEKIIFGLANLHFRFGHVSIIQYLSAINLNFFTNFIGISIPSAVIASVVILNFIAKFRIHIIKKNYNFHFYYLMGILIYIFIKMNRYSEYGNDAPAHFLAFYFLSEFLLLNKNNLKVNKIMDLSLIGVFIVLNKLTLFLILIIPLYLVLKTKFFEVFKNVKFYFILIFGLMWILKNIIVSGCLLYPVNITCNKNLFWSDIVTVEKISLENEAFSKNWPNFKDRNKVTKLEYINNFNWFKTWSKKFLDEQKEKSFAFSFILIFFYLIIVTKSKKNKKNLEKNILFLFILILSTFFWLIKIPDFRYLYSIIISLITYFFALTLSNRTFNKDQRKFFSSIILLFFLAFIFKNFIRIFNTSAYYDYPNPRIYSHNDDNNKLNYKLKIINNKKIYHQQNGYCMYTKTLCTPYEININIKYKKSYLFFFKKT